eukprot:3866059-Pyramimonas_sp.AAC.2
MRGTRGALLPGDLDSTIGVHRLVMRDPLSSRHSVEKMRTPVNSLGGWHSGRVYASTSLGSFGVHSVLR